MFAVPMFPPADLNLNVVAMALSGYTDEKASLWREMCSTLRLQLKKPYLCAMFAFLTSEPGAYDAVLVRNETHVTANNAARKLMLKVALSQDVSVCNSTRVASP